MQDPSNPSTPTQALNAFETAYQSVYREAHLANAAVQQAIRDAAGRPDEHRQQPQPRRTQRGDPRPRPRRTPLHPGAPCRRLTAPTPQHG